MDFFSLMEKFFKKSICIDSSPLMVSLFSIVCIILEVPSVLKFIPKYKLLTWFKALHELTLPQPSVSSPAFSYTSSLHTNLHYSPTPVLVLFPLFRMPSAFHGSLFLWSIFNCLLRPAPYIIFCVHSWTLHCDYIPGCS